MPRVLALGLDAVSLPFVRAEIDGGGLPNLRRLLDGSTVATFTSPPGFRAELPWTEFSIGRDPRAEGYWGTVAFDAAHYQVGEAGAMPSAPWWTVGEAPVTVALDIPHSVLAPGAPGIGVVAWGAHSAQYPPGSEPDGIYAELVRRFGSHPAVRNDSAAGWHHPGYIEALTRAHELGAARRADAFLWLLGLRPDWELAITVFPEPHTAGHTFWHGVDPGHPAHRHESAASAKAHLGRVLAAIDASIGRILAGVGASGAGAAGDESAPTVVLFSVHDMERNGSDVVAGMLLPELLHRTTFGWSLLRDPRPSPWRNGRVDVPLAVPRGDRGIGDVLAAARRTVRPGALDAPRAIDAAADAVRDLRRRFRAARPGERRWFDMDDRPFEPSRRTSPTPPAWGSLDYQGAAWYRPWWPKMRSFVLPTFSDPHVRVNLQGREAQGVVAPEDFDAELRRIEHLLAPCTDPRTGAPMFAWTDRPRPEGDDPATGPAADLVVKVVTASDALHHPSIGVIGPFPFLRTGEHGVNGFVATPRHRLEVPTARRPADLAAVLRSLLV